MGHQPRGTVPTTPTGIPLEAPDALLQAYLDDDLGDPPRDVTSDPLFPPAVRGRAVLVAREALVASGLHEAVRVFALCGATAEAHVTDGTRSAAGTVLLTVAGPVRSILRAERTALNIVGRMSGIATLTARIQKTVAAVNPRCRVAATRKTTPGFRLLEKRAVVHGGGDAHRYGLFDQVLIKDNHRAAGGDVGALVRRLRTAAPDVAIQVEVEDAQDAEGAARAGVDMVLLDNRSVPEAKRLAQLVRGIDADILIEASGGITEATAAHYAPFVDRISMGALTNRAAAADVALDWDRSGA